MKIVIVQSCFLSQNQSVERRKVLQPVVSELAVLAIDDGQRGERFEKGQIDYF